MRTYFRLQSSIITLFDVKIGRFIANHSFQFARKSVIANIISIETAGQMLGVLKHAHFNQPKHTYTLGCCFCQSMNTALNFIDFD